MSRGLDHIVHAVHDLDAAGEFYSRLGFTVGARNRHAWGTHNRLIQFSGFFIEILAVAEPEKLGSDGFSLLFGKFNERFLKRGEGFSLLILESSGVSADAHAFQANHIAASDILRFEREGKRPDGSAVKVAFSLVFARDDIALNIGFAVCQQHFPENFWNPAFQKHPNTAKSIGGVVIVAENPADHHIFLSAFAGERELQSSSSGVTVKTRRGEIQVMDPGAFETHFGVTAPDVTNGARLAVVRLLVGDINTAAAMLRRSEVVSQTRMNRLVVGPNAAHGATIVFEAG